MSGLSQVGFNAVSSDKPKKEVAVPLSFRVTPSEKAAIKRLAADRPLSTYLRHVALNGKAMARRKAHAPTVNDAKVAQILARLGQSRLAANLNQIAKAANMGALPVTDELIAELSQACADIQMMRSDLIQALGIKAED